jgi:hypothetical protein
MAKGKATSNGKPPAKVPPKKAAPSKNAAPKKASAPQHTSSKGSRKRPRVADDLDNPSSEESSGEEPEPRPQKKRRGKQKKIDDDDDAAGSDDEVVVDKARPPSDSEDGLHTQHRIPITAEVLTQKDKAKDLRLIFSDKVKASFIKDGSTETLRGRWCNICK